MTGGTTIATISNQSLSNLNQTIYVTPTTARYIRFNGTARATGYGYSFYEFEVYGDSYQNGIDPTTVPAIKTVGVDGITEVKALYNQGAKENGFDFATWSGRTDPTPATIDGKSISLFSNFNYFGGEYTDFDASKWDKLVVDIYPLTDLTVNVFPIHVGATEYSTQYTLTKNQWNTLEVDLQQLYNNGSGLDISLLNQLKVNGGTGSERFYLGNIYYYSTHILYSAPTDVPAIITTFNDGTTTHSIASDQVTKIYTVDGNATNYGSQTYNDTSIDTNVTTINSKQVLKLDNFNTLVGSFDSQDLSSADYLHVDVYPMAQTNLTVFHSQTNQKGVRFTNLTPGQWNSFDIPVSSFGNPASTNTLLLTQNMTEAGAESHADDIANVTIYLGNYYYFRTASVPDTEAPVMTSATVSNIGTTTATLTVSATDNKEGTLTYHIYNGSTSGTLLATATGAAGLNTTVNLTGLMVGETYNLVVTATDAANHTSESMSVTEFTTQDYIPTLTTIQVIMKGESTDAFNTSSTGYFERVIRVIALDQRGTDLPSRSVTLRITDGNNGTNDVSFVNTMPNTVTKAGTEGSTAIRVNSHVGRVTVEAVDNQTGKTGYGFLTFYDARNTAASNEDQLISDPNQVSSAKITGASTDIITIAASGHGTYNYVSDGEQPAEFVVDWSSIQNNQQHYEYYDIDMIQILFQQGKFPTDYTISVSHDGGNTYENVYHYDGTQNMYIDPVNPLYRADAWNASRQNTEAVSHIRFRSNNNQAIAFDAFKVYGQLNSVVDDNPPYDLYAGLVDQSNTTDQVNKTSTAQIWLECKDDQAQTINYTITSATGMQYTISGPAGGGVSNQVRYDFNNTLVPGTHYVFTIVASDGRNRSNPQTVTIDTPPLNQSPKVSAEATNLSSTTATLNYWLPSTDNTLIGADDDIVFVVKNGTTVVADSKYKKGQADENNKIALNLTGLVPNTAYTYSVTATNSATGLSSEVSVQLTTHQGGSNLEVWFTDGGTHYTGWTGELEDIITNSSKGNQNLLSVTELHINGSLNNEDIKVLRRMAGGDSYIGNTAVKSRLLIKANAEPYVYAWDNHGALLGEFPGYKLTTKTDGYYVCEFEQEGVNIVINNGQQDGQGNTNNQTSDITLQAGNNYFTYNGGNGYTNQTTSGYYGSLATLDLAQASFYHDGGAYVIRWYANANTPTILNPIGGQFVSSPNIEGYMFQNCRNLRTVTLPADCKQVGVNAFFGGEGNDGISLTTINFNEGLEVIAGYAFEKNENLGVVTLPSTLQSIGYNAFCDCYAMTLGNTNGQLPNSITFIDNQAFANTSIAAVILPANASYTTVTTNCFGWNSKLTSVTIPNNVTTIMNGAFRDSGKLANIDFTANPTITEIGDEAFLNDIVLPSAHVNRLIRDLTVLNNGVFKGCLAVTNVNIPASVTTLKNLTFANCTAINLVTVNGATAPTGYTITDGEMKDGQNITTDPFAAVVANHMTLAFAGEAVSGFRTYRAGTAQSNPFRRLLTKTLDDNATTYDVAGQMHADVVLKRAMVEGWNTLALPFGVKAGDLANRDRDYTAAGVYKAAFNGTDEEDDKFMIAAYRGIEDDVFKFLKYASYTTDPLDEFEPLLIRMGASNIAENNEYTFVDVDLNYDLEKNYLYREANANEEVPVKRWDGSKYVAFTGSNYNHDWSWFSGTTDEYGFAGTYTKKTTLDKVTNFDYDSDYFIKPGDYIIQSNSFYEVLETKKYGLKGYRAWFQKQPVAGESRPATLRFMVFEPEEQTPTEIVSLDAAGTEVVPQDIYNMRGQLVRKGATSTEGLPRGLYIMGGRKIVVK